MEPLEGSGPDGAPVSVDLSSGTHTVWFLTSSCPPCGDVWPRLLPGDVAVTPSAATENRRKVAALAPPGVTVVMSSPTWLRFRPGPAPWKVVVRDGVVVDVGG